jgi:hypothetical protein
MKIPQLAICELVNYLSCRPIAARLLTKASKVFSPDIERTAANAISLTE